MSSTALNSASPSRGWTFGLWAAQILLAVPFTMAGLMKTTTSPDELVAMGMGFAGRVPSFAVPVIGTLELLGAIGLILPAALRIAPILTPMAAAGLTLTMLVAGLDHLVAGEVSSLPVPIVFGSIAAFIAWGRLVKAPVQPR